MLIKPHSKLINDQIKNIKSGKIADQTIELQKLVDTSIEYLRAGEVEEFAKLMNEGWRIKKSLSNKISIPYIDSIYNLAIETGALGGKLLGAGGGGFFMFYVPQDKAKQFDLNMDLKFTFKPRPDFDGVRSFRV